LVCGEFVREGVVFVRTQKSDKAKPGHPPVRDSYDINDLQYENVVVEGALHTNCAKLTRAHCKPIQERLRDDIYEERPYTRGRFRRGNKPRIEYR
jgi:hypothetical protein